MKFRFSLLVALSQLLSHADVHAGQILKVDDPIDNAYIAVFEDGVSTLSVQARIDTIVAQYPDATVTRTFTSALQGFAAVMTAEVAEAMADSADIAYIEQDGRVYAGDIIESAAVDTWGLDRIDQKDLPLDDNYSPFGHGAGVTTYILDTGIHIDHEEFDNNRASWGENTTGDGNDTDCHGHGTHVAGTVVGKKYGVANQARTVAVKVLNCGGSGSTSGVIAGVDWVKANAKKPATANMSLGGSSNVALNDAVNDLHNSGVPTVVAAGNNSGDACLKSPAGASDIISIASSDSSDRRSSFSNFGECTEMFAPGTDIKSAWNTGDSDYNTISGTSMASPHVCGAVALLLEKRIPPEDVKSKLEEMATPGKIIDAKTSPNLLLFVGPGEETESPTPPGEETESPTPPPTESPSPPPPGEDCVDSKALFEQKDGRFRQCRFVAKRPQMCSKPLIQSYCPNVCKACDEYGCSDAMGSFKLCGKCFKTWTCEELSKLPDNKVAKKCKRKKFMTTCRDTCKLCDK